MNENIHFLAGLEKVKKEEYQGAIESFTNSLQVAPQHLASLYNRGMARFKLEDYKGAIKDFDEAINLAPSNADIYSQRGVAKHLLGLSEDSLADFDKAAELEPQNPYRYSSRAFVKARLKDVFGAMDDYQKAIALDPEDAIAYNNLGLLEEQVGYGSARERFKKADELTGGQFANKPSLDETLKKHKETNEEGQKAALFSASANGQQHQRKMAQKPKQSIGAYLKIIGQVFTSRQTFGEFVAFVASGAKKKE